MPGSTALVLRNPDAYAIVPTDPAFTAPGDEYLRNLVMKTEANRFVSSLALAACIFGGTPNLVELSRPRVITLAAPSLIATTAMSASLMLEINAHSRLPEISTVFMPTDTMNRICSTDIPSRRID
ncbi:MAG: hypothetical protein Q7V63_04645 [Gammaproteobacteria bacterium]|nr:hypothetical protein [Gammaproteobacteria bacterium]